jgi:hypothetical protein
MSILLLALFLNHTMDTITSIYEVGSNGLPAYGMNASSSSFSLVQAVLAKWR